MITSISTGLVQRDEPVIMHGLTILTGVNGQEEKGSLDILAWADSDSPVVTTNIEQYFNGIHCHGAVKSFGGDTVLNGFAEYMNAELDRQGIVR